jgi:hypothetical protein
MSAYFYRGDMVIDISTYIMNIFSWKVSASICSSESKSCSLDEAVAFAHHILTQLFFAKFY